MSRTPFDTYAKELTEALLAPYGKVESDARIATEPQFADLRFSRAPTSRERPWDFVTASLAPRMMFEFARRPPDVATMVSWTHKRDGWFLQLRREAKRRRRALPALPPLLCVLSAGDPVDARRSYKMEVPVSPGCYEGAPEGTLRLVVLSQLPKTRATLLARTMASGATLRDALVELLALSPDARERTISEPSIVRLRVELARDPAPESREIFMQTQKLYETLIQRHVARGLKEGLKEGRKEGLKEGLKEGIEQGLREAILHMCATRALKITTAQRAKLAAESDTATLRRWLTRAATVGRAREVFSES